MISRLLTRPLASASSGRCGSRVFAVPRHIDSAPDQRAGHHDQADTMCAEGKGPIEVQPAELGQQIFPVVSLHFGAGLATKEDKPQCTRVAYVWAQVDQILSGPPRAHGGAEL